MVPASARSQSHSLPVRKRAPAAPPDAIDDNTQKESLAFAPGLKQYIAITPRHPTCFNGYGAHIIVLLLVGVGLGPVLKWADPSHFPDMMRILGMLALILILFGARS